MAGMPWDTPVGDVPPGFARRPDGSLVRVAPAAPVGPNPLEQLLGQPQLAPQNGAGPTSPGDAALLQALLKKKVNQAFAGATGNPLPQ